MPAILVHRKNAYEGQIWVVSGQGNIGIPILQVLDRSKFYCCILAQRGSAYKGWIPHKTTTTTRTITHIKVAIQLTLTFHII